MTTLPLNDLSRFEESTPNWQILGGITADLENQYEINPVPGTGVLANVQSEDAKGHLFTSWSHSDIELDLEVLMPKGSNSGIYFQGRYEIQLFDSWGVGDPEHSDIGGIYQRWDEGRSEGEKGYEGHSPRLGVARAPGLWQHINVLFKAPRFDPSGNKIQNARFERVALNGVVIHENAELTGPTRAAAFENEVPVAPLMIQGDHGPVAFRNISYRFFNPGSVNLSDIVLSYFEGDFNHQMPDFSTLSLVTEKEVGRVTSEDAAAERRFALQYAGNISVPESGNYIFEVAHTSRASLELNGRVVLTDQSERVNGPREFPRNQGQIYLTEGNHSFVLRYAKGNWHGAPTTLGWYVSGPGLMRTELTAPGSVPHDVYSAYQIKPEEEPWMQRNFVLHQGEKRTHAISVGFPSGINYSYDMSRGALLHVWKGPFVDTSTMWYQRGNLQSALPMGSVIERSGLPVVSPLENDSAAWPDSLETYVFKRYEINDSGAPVFIYDIDGLMVREHILPDDEAKKLIRTVEVEGELNDHWLLVAESSSIVQQDDTSFMIDDQRMYIEINEGSGVKIRMSERGQQLIVPLSGVAPSGRVQYTYIW